MRTISVVPYNHHWPEAYTSEAASLKNVLKSVVISIHHIGSTSVPGLPSKPVLDMLIEVTSLAELERSSASLNALGYTARGENGIPGRRYFTKGETPRTHQIHAFAVNDEHIHRHVVFRDYLRENSDVRDEYAALKITLADKFKYDPAGYSAGKEPFIRLHQSIALKRGEAPPPG